MEVEDAEAVMRRGVLFETAVRGREVAVVRGLRATVREVGAAVFPAVRGRRFTGAFLVVSSAIWVSIRAVMSARAAVSPAAS